GREAAGRRTRDVDLECACPRGPLEARGRGGIERPRRRLAALPRDLIVEELREARLVAFDPGLDHLRSHPGDDVLASRLRLGWRGTTVLGAIDQASEAIESGRYTAQARLSVDAADRMFRIALVTVDDELVDVGVTRERLDAEDRIEETARRVATVRGEAIGVRA